MLPGSSCPCEEDSEFPGLSLPSACWFFKTMGSSCELVKLWNVTKDAAQSQMAPISPSNANKVSWKEGHLTHTTMHRMIYINNICTAAGTFAHKSSHTPSTATIHFPYRYTHHLYINMFILTEICRQIAGECQVCCGTSVPARSITPWDSLTFTKGPDAQNWHPSLGNTPFFIFIILRRSIDGKVQICIHIWKGELNTMHFHTSVVLLQTFNQWLERWNVSTQTGSSAASFWSTTFVPAISPPVSALSEFASSSHPLVMLQWYWWDFWRSLWAFSFLPHHPLCSAPLKDQSQRLSSPFMKDLTFVYLTPQLFINSVCFNWKFG